VPRNQPTVTMDQQLSYRRAIPMYVALYF